MKTLGRFFKSVDSLSDFAKHSLLFTMVLIVIVIGVALDAPQDVISPLSQGLGMALPALLGGHALVSGVSAWKGDPNARTDLGAGSKPSDVGEERSKND